MSKNQMRNRRSRRTVSRQWWSVPAAMLTTLLALPVNAAIDMPDVPLTTGSRVAPNILFILDNSGSMSSDFMPDDVPPTSNPDVSDLAYPRNTLSYNPAVTYQAWVQANGTRMTSGTSFDDVYDNDQMASGSMDLRNNDQTFYVPKNTINPTAADLANGTKYYRYQILKGGADIKRAVYGPIVLTGLVSVGVTPSSGTVNRSSNTHSLGTVVSGLTMLITLTSTSNRSKDYVVKNPSGSTVCSGSIQNSDVDSCKIDPTAAGVYTVTMSRSSNNNADYSLSALSYSSNNSCDGLFSGSGWIDCQSILPNSNRLLEAEKTNYAIWYSYYRTRMKAAKAGAAEAFKSVGYKSRVGFRTISQGNTNAIPVSSFDGRFGDNPATLVDEGINRTNWYSTLFAAQGTSYTPLRSALKYAGQYFEGTSSAGAYGPQLGTISDPQYSCRQNFTILTTDGYWNTNTETGSPGGIGNADDTSETEITGPNGQSYTYTAAAPYRDGYSTTLADIASYYWKRDLRTAASFNKSGSDDNNVPSSASDPAFWQHMVTFGISIGLAGNKPWTSVSDVPGNATWQDPTDAEDKDRIDDLLHAAVNGHGAFVSASSPAKFAAGLRAALAAIDQRAGSYSNVATNSVSLDSGAQVFNASYTAGVWTGALNARAVSDTGVSSTVAWSASIPTSGRNVWTSNATSLVPFLTSSQAGALSRPVGASELYPVSSADNAAYISGDQNGEESNGGTLRNRNSLLGDIVGSSPAFVKGGTAGDGSANGTLYVGANDGMLHAFNATNGNEVFAYIPNIIDWNALKSYSSGEYSHRFFVDGPIVVSNKTLTANKNILIGSLGKGGTGLYALDVTSPTSPSFKWDMKDTASPTAGFMGKVLGKPVLGLVKGSASAILGNGVDSISNKAALIIVKNIDSGSPTTVVVDTGEGTAGSPNALFAPIAVLGQDGKTVSTVYAGDMLGNLWKFDLSTTVPTVKKLFAAGVTKRITSGVTVAVHPTTNKRWVFFGTGRFLVDSDLSNTDTQSMYGIIDEDTLVLDSQLDVQDPPVASGDFRTFQKKTALDTGKKGWRVNLPISGERIVQDMQLVSTFLISASMIPSGDACGADGKGYINALDAFTGTSAGGSYFDPPGGSTVSIGGENVPIGSINVGNGMPTLPNLLRGLIVVGGTGGSELRSVKTLTPRWDRVSWREVRGD